MDTVKIIPTPTCPSIWLIMHIIISESLKFSTCNCCLSHDVCSSSMLCTKFVPTNMKEKWQELSSVEYMTEESSDDEEDGCLIMLQKLPWRSPGEVCIYGIHGEFCNSHWMHNMSLEVRPTM